MNLSGQLSHQLGLEFIVHLLLLTDIGIIWKIMVLQKQISLKKKVLKHLLKNVKV